MTPRRLPAARAALPAVLLLAGCVGEEALVRPEPLYGPDGIEYPVALWDAGVEGETTLRVRVTDTGVVDSIEVAGTSGYPGLDSAAVVGVRALRFMPGRLSDRPARMWATLPVLFTKRGPPGDRRRALPPAVR